MAETRITTRKLYYYEMFQRYIQVAQGDFIMRLIYMAVQVVSTAGVVAGLLNRPWAFLLPVPAFAFYIASCVTYGWLWDRRKGIDVKMWFMALRSPFVRMTLNVLYRVAENEGWADEIEWTDKHIWLDGDW